MNNGFRHALKTFLLLATSFLPLALCPAGVFADPAQLLEQIRVQEDKYRQLSAEFYQLSSQSAENKKQSIDDIDVLLRQIIHLADSGQSVAAIELIYSSIDTVNDNLDHKAIFRITELLLDNNEWNLADRLYQKVSNEGDRSLLPTIKFIFAKYHARRNEWQQVNSFLNSIYTELSADNAAYAYLLNGSALQFLKQHRDAIESYSKIPASSQYYTYAQLNTAIANIRQGWWTDAQTTIKELIRKANIDNSDELTNRLYLVLGYALLQRDYYRDARDAFRNIGVDSRYTNRALLGIGLTATSQGDYVGGLNALSILKDKKTFDLSVDESYLLVPYVYEKLQQELTVTASYTEAMEYYQQRINTLTNISAQKINFITTEYDDKSASIIVENNSLDYGTHYPESFIQNYLQLFKFSSLNNNSRLKKKIDDLISQHDAIFQKIANDLINQRIEYLKSYLNQSRYGLARLYDSSNEAAK